MTAFWCLGEGIWDDRDGFLTVLHGGRARGNEQRWKQERFRWGIKGKLSSMSSGVGCPERLCHLHPWRISKTWLDQALSSLLWPQSWTSFGQSVGLETSWGSSQPELSHTERRPCHCLAGMQTRVMPSCRKHRDGCHGDSHTCLKMGFLLQNSELLKSSRARASLEVVLSLHRGKRSCNVKLFS